MSKLQTELNNEKRNRGIVTFQNAKTEPLHRWFPYLEGFGEDFIDSIVQSDKGIKTWIYEPFGGSGTVPVYALKNGMNCSYHEVNPFMAKVTQIKIEALQSAQLNRKVIIEQCHAIRNTYSSDIVKCVPNEKLKRNYEKVFSPSKYFDDENFELVLKSKSFLESLESNEANALSTKLLWLAMTESLLHSSLLKRAGDIRYRKGKELENIPRFNERVEAAFNKIIDDLEELVEQPKDTITVYSPNAKEELKTTEFADIIITSPPYLNGTNYIRNTKLELWFDSILETKKDLSYYRSEVVTAGINDVIKAKKEFVFKPLEELFQLNTEWYDRRIPKMINDYFYDMRKVLINCHLALKKGKALYLDIGDSIYGGNYIPTHNLLTMLAEEVGFRHEETVTLRRRKSKKGGELSQVLIKLVKE